MIRIEIDSTNLQALKLLEFLRGLPGFKIIEENDDIDYPASKNIPNEITKKSLENLHQKKGTRAKDVKDLMRKLKS